MRGKLIVIEGTDCSGKETQTNLLIKKLKSDGYKVENFSFPNYNSPTGKIIGGPYLGKDYISESFFEEGASNVDPLVASLYYAADRKYNIDKIELLLKEGYHIILDRYTYSNMAHQAGKLENKEDREKMYHFLEHLEFELLNLPRPDITIFLHMPTEVSEILKQKREEKPDGHEKDTHHLKLAEKTYLEIAKKYNFNTIECSANNKPKTIEEISDLVYKIVKENL